MASIFPWKHIRISYAITVCNELDEFTKLMELLISTIDSNDEIIILSDKTNVTQEILHTISVLQEKHSLIHISHPLNNDFASFKNRLLEPATGDYLFQIDADEVPGKKLIKKLKFKLFRHCRRDCFLVPRVNYVDGVTEEHIKKWGWKIDDKGRINYPDAQMRLFRLNTGIRWENKVHEVLTGCKKKKRLPYKKNENYCLYHPKKINRQERQNVMYDKITSQNTDM